MRYRLHHGRANDKSQRLSIKKVNTMRRVLSIALACVMSAIAIAQDTQMAQVETEELQVVTGEIELIKFGDLTLIKGDISEKKPVGIVTVVAAETASVTARFEQLRIDNGRIVRDTLQPNVDETGRRFLIDKPGTWDYFIITYELVDGSIVINNEQGSITVGEQLPRPPPDTPTPGTGAEAVRNASLNKARQLNEPFGALKLAEMLQADIDKGMAQTLATAQARQDKAFTETMRELFKPGYKTRWAEWRTAVNQAIEQVPLQSVEEYYGLQRAAIKGLKEAAGVN